MFVFSTGIIPVDQNKFSAVNVLLSEVIYQGMEEGEELEDEQRFLVLIKTKKAPEINK